MTALIRNIVFIEKGIIVQINQIQSYADQLEGENL
jgi:hypothetical protein